MRRIIAATVAATVLIVPALASPADARTHVASAGPYERPNTKIRDLDMNEFFRQTITINRNDTVHWRMNGFHTVTFPAKGQAPPPFVIPDPSGKLTSGVNDASGNPFWFNGQPQLVVNSAVALPAGGSSYDGEEYANSGLPGDGPPKPYRLKFTKTGTYDYYCIVHAGMKAKVRVLPRGVRTPSARANRSAARSEQARTLRRIKAKHRSNGPSGDVVLAGNDATDYAFFRFFPRIRTVDVGDTVTFRFSRRSGEIHNVAFGPQSVRNRLARNFFKPVPQPNGPPSFELLSQIIYPSDPPPAVPDYDGTNHGDGFLNTGVIDADSKTPSPREAKVRFTKAGSFEYECLVHPGMKGRIRVR